MAASNSDTTQSSLLEQQQYYSLRERLLAFYEQYHYHGNADDENQIFTSYDQQEALAYFDAAGENISHEELLQRRSRMIFMLEQTKAWAQGYKRKFLSRLYQLDIALDRKKELEKEFCSGSFRDKSRLFEFIVAEENRIERKKTQQMMERESYKSSFYAFFEANAEYFCPEDRISAWNNVVISLNSFQTHIGKMRRLRMLLAMLPANLEYARSLDNKYQQLLAHHIEDDERRGKCLEAFRKCTFEHKLKRIQELEKSPTTSEQQQKLAKEKLANNTLFNNLFALFPHGLTPEQFADLSLEEQKKALSKKLETNNREEELVTNLLKHEGISTETLTRFRAMSIASKKDYLATATQTQRESTSDKAETEPEEKQKTVTSIKPLKICAIAVSVLRNREKKEFADDKARIKTIKTKMIEEGILGEFTATHLNILRDIIAAIPEDERETSQALQWIDKQMRERIYMGESHNANIRKETTNHIKSARTKMPNFAQNA
ncbi:MAG: hypothetical protein HY817_03360 [Candidatus Abawacabacteria bacterium]|nr:hypothetical protein [Candidatus Abawacabacteria bacterium]